MSRALSTLAKQAIFAESTGEVFLLLLTLSHATLLTPIRVVLNTENIVSRGNTFLAFPFEFVLPGEREDQIPRCRLRIDNVDRQIVTALRNATSAIALLAEIVLAAQPDTVDATFDGFTLKDARYDVLIVEGDLALEDPLNEPAIADRFTPSNFPGIF
jgi:hypothetical protein